MPRSSADDLNSIIAEIAQFTRASEIPRRIELTRDALTMVDRNDNPDISAALFVQLARGLQQNPMGDRGKNMEEAIRCYNISGLLR